MARVVDLDRVMLAPEVAVCWSNLAQEVAKRMALLEVVLSFSDEQARINDDGSLTIFVTGELEISMTVPAGRWSHR